MEFNIQRYIEKKQKGLVKLTKLGEAYVLAWDVFDIETGVKKTPIIESLDLDNLKKLKTQSDDLTKSIGSLITDLEALK